ncbi:MAG: hypothetical protein WBZ42_00470, partial [Halobacteriota archaeon]
RNFFFVLEADFETQECTQNKPPSRSVKSAIAVVARAPKEAGTRAAAARCSRDAGKGCWHFAHLLRVIPAIAGQD